MPWYPLRHRFSRPTWHAVRAPCVVESDQRMKGKARAVCLGWQRTGEALLSAQRETEREKKRKKYATTDTDTQPVAARRWVSGCASVRHAGTVALTRLPRSRHTYTALRATHRRSCGSCPGSTLPQLGPPPAPRSTRRIVKSGGKI